MRAAIGRVQQFVDCDVGIWSRESDGTCRGKEGRGRTGLNSLVGARKRRAERLVREARYPDIAGDRQKRRTYVRPLSPSVQVVRVQIPCAPVSPTPPPLRWRVSPSPRARSLAPRDRERTAPARASDFRNVTVRVLADCRSVGRSDERASSLTRGGPTTERLERRRWVSSAVVAASSHGEREIAVQRGEAALARRDRRSGRREEKDGRCERKMSLGDTRARMTGSDRRSDARESEVVGVSPRRRWWWWWWLLPRSSSTSSSSSSLRGAAGAVVPALATARAPDRRERQRPYRAFPAPPGIVEIGLLPHGGNVVAASTAGASRAPRLPKGRARRAHRLFEK